MYIRAAGNISPQKTFGHPPFPQEPVETFGDRLACIEPAYKNIIDAKLLRRMSRIIRMGVAAATECLKEAGITEPDAIITGTAYGCLEDTGIFLTKMVEQQEEMLSPTAFIQSTHNTVGAQIALLLQCHRYNNTFVHKAFSFENALLDAILLLKEEEAEQVLVGGIDEITGISHSILSRFGLYKTGNASNLQMFTDRSRGTIAGEGAAFFLLSAHPSPADYARLIGTATFYKPSDITADIKKFLALHDETIAGIDLVITGDNGNISTKESAHPLLQVGFEKELLINYKHLCGEYPTASAFALWLAANILKSGIVPPVTIPGNFIMRKRPGKILIYNTYQPSYHSLLLVTAC